MSWDAHVQKAIGYGAKTSALFGKDGVKWGGASAAGASPVRGVSVVTNFAGLMAALSSGAMPSSKIVVDGITYWPTRCTKNEILAGKDSKTGTCICLGPSNKAVIFCTGASGEDAKIFIALASTIDYIKGIGF